MSDSLMFELKVVDRYLGFEIRPESEGQLLAVPTFLCAEEPVLAAASMPQLRKRIWKWWHALDASR
jgi:hypothetical protein